MKHLRKYNESANEGQFYTWDELLFRIENGDVNLLDEEKHEVLDMVGEYINLKSSRDPEFHNTTIVPKNGIFSLRDLVIVFDSDNAPIAILTEYEMSGPTVFGDVVMLPGHDSITLYNRVTGEHKRHHIR